MARWLDAPAIVSDQRIGCQTATVQSHLASFLADMRSSYRIIMSSRSVKALTSPDHR